MVEIRGNQRFDVVVKNSLELAFGCLFDHFVDFLDSRLACRIERQIDHRNIDGRNTHGKTVELAVQFRQHQTDSSGLMNQEYIDPEVVTSPQEAFYADKESVPLEDSVGKVCSEFVMCYPPGIPILAPGERITKEILEYIQYAKAKGCSMTGPEDPEIERINILTQEVG